MKKLFIAFICLIFLGCAGNQIAPEKQVCNNVPEGQYSVLCTISNYMHVPLENVSQVLQAADAGGLLANLYTAQQAENFIQGIRTYLNTSQSGSGLVYSALMKYLTEKYGLLPAKIQAVITIVKPFGSVNISAIPGADMKLSPYDYELLEKGLQEQEKIIQPFLM